MSSPAAAPPCSLLRRPEPALFAGARAHLDRQYRLWSTTAPAPLPAPGLVISPELRYQSELYLPIAEVSRSFHRFYRFSLSFPPHLNSTPFSGALSWADLYGSLPDQFHLSPNPARLLACLLDDDTLRCRFLFHSFLPARHNGAGFGRYPEQIAFLENLCTRRREAGLRSIRCLDAACGSGEGTWELAELLAAAGWQPHQAGIEGWSLDPLEIWAARQRCLPHDPARQAEYRGRTEPLLAAGWEGRISFTAVDLLNDHLPQPVYGESGFDLILCNGLLGGPLLKQPAAMLQVIGRLSGLLHPGGRLLATDRFHGGWKQKTPEALLRGLFETAGLRAGHGGGGVVGIRT